MRSRGLLTGAAYFAGQLIRNPIKTTLNTIEGIKAGPDFPDNKIVTGLMGAGGLVATFLGAINRDPLLTGIGLTFTAAAGGIYEPRGAQLRAEAHAATLAAEPKEEPVPQEKAEEAAKEKPSEIVEPATEAPIGPFGKTPVFKPNLPRPTGLDGP